MYSFIENSGMVSRVIFISKDMNTIQAIASEKSLNISKKLSIFFESYKPRHARRKRGWICVCGHNLYGGTVAFFL